MDVPESFRDVRERFEAGVAGGEEVGASFCVMVDGEVVVDLWGGHADRARTRPWQRDTIVNVWSATKPIAALIALLTVDETRPVAHYWPEFAANGKKRDITVAQVLSHSSGLSAGGSRSPPRISTTGRSARRCWPRRSRSGSPAPPPDTT